MLPGTYDAIIISAKIRTTDSGTPSVSIKAAVNDGTDTIELYGDLWLTPACIARTRTALKEMGFDYETRDLSEIDGGALENVKTKAKVFEDTYKGQTRLKIDRFGNGTNIDAKKIKDLTALLREKSNQTTVKKIAPVAPKAADDLSIDEEIVPF